MWAESFTKLLAFNQTQYKRLVVLDSDATILKSTDELFFIPDTTAALLQAYWLSKPYLSSHLMVIQPSKWEFERIQKAILKAKPGTYDMDIINKLHGDTCMHLPHRKYGLLTGEFRSNKHEAYMGHEEWDATAAINEAKLVHFSDYPFPKPWYEATKAKVEKLQPECVEAWKSEPDCRARYIWLDLYSDFQERIKVSFSDTGC